ncbi:AMP-binding enzyme [Giardia muris]|uniref:AMP-binding enzyme n=1 Tax=Giardia muris TaxID=5742 RepID=A0A4Z1SPP8_GIAMU|nr:AMP-binding enzyme [Giardia muris]|eukprot:TNJ27804.1 AMP-binding enzyme [Giardia muris]
MTDVLRLGQCHDMRQVYLNIPARAPAPTLSPYLQLYELNADLTALQNYRLAAAQWPTQPHLSFRNGLATTGVPVPVYRSITYRESNAAVNRLAAALKYIGLGPQRKIGIFSSTCPLLLLLDYAVMALGGVSVIIPASLPYDHLIYAINYGGLQAILTQGQFVSTLMGVAHKCPALSLVVTLDSLPNDTETFPEALLVYAYLSGRQHLTYQIQDSELSLSENVLDRSFFVDLTEKTCEPFDEVRSEVKSFLAEERQETRATTGANVTGCSVDDSDDELDRRKLSNHVAHFNNISPYSPSALGIPEHLVTPGMERLMAIRSQLNDFQSRFTSPLTALQISQLVQAASYSDEIPQELFNLVAHLRLKGTSLELAKDTIGRPYFPGKLEQLNILPLDYLLETTRFEPFTAQNDYPAQLTDVSTIIYGDVGLESKFAFLEYYFGDTVTNSSTKRKSHRRPKGTGSEGFGLSNLKNLGPLGNFTNLVTQNPVRAVVYTHRSFMSAIRSTFVNHLPYAHAEFVKGRSNYFCHLPFSDPFERLMEHGCTARGYQLSFYSGRFQNLFVDLYLSKPTVFAGPPRFFSKLHSYIVDYLNQAAVARRNAFEKTYAVRLAKLTTIYSATRRALRLEGRLGRIQYLENQIQHQTLPRTKFSDGTSDVERTPDSHERSASRKVVKNQLITPLSEAKVLRSLARTAEELSDIGATASDARYSLSEQQEAPPLTYMTGDTKPKLNTLIYHSRGLLTPTKKDKEKHDPSSTAEGPIHQVLSLETLAHKRAGGVSDETAQSRISQIKSPLSREAMPPVPFRGTSGVCADTLGLVDMDPDLNPSESHTDPSKLWNVPSESHSEGLFCKKNHLYNSFGAFSDATTGCQPPPVSQEHEMLKHKELQKMQKKIQRSIQKASREKDAVLRELKKMQIERNLKEALKPTSLAESPAIGRIQSMFGGMLEHLISNGTRLEEQTLTFLTTVLGCYGSCTSTYDELSGGGVYSMSQEKGPNGCMGRPGVGMSCRILDLSEGWFPETIAHMVLRVVFPNLHIKNPKLYNKHFTDLLGRISNVMPKLADTLQGELCLRGDMVALGYYCGDPLYEFTQKATSVQHVPAHENMSIHSVQASPFLVSSQNPETPQMDSSATAYELARSDTARSQTIARRNSVKLGVSPVDMGKPLPSMRYNIGGLPGISTLTSPNGVEIRDESTYSESESSNSSLPRFLPTSNLSMTTNPFSGSFNRHYTRYVSSHQLRLQDYRSQKKTDSTIETIHTLKTRTFEQQTNEGPNIESIVSSDPGMILEGVSTTSGMCWPDRLPAKTGASTAADIIMDGEFLGINKGGIGGSTADMLEVYGSLSDSFKDSDSTSERSFSSIPILVGSIADAVIDVLDEDSYFHTAELVEVNREDGQIIFKTTIRAYLDRHLCPIIEAFLKEFKLKVLACDTVEQMAEDLSAMLLREGLLPMTKEELIERFSRPAKVSKDDWPIGKLAALTVRNNICKGLNMWVRLSGGHCMNVGFIENVLVHDIFYVIDLLIYAFEGATRPLAFVCVKGDALLEAMQRGGLALASTGDVDYKSTKLTNARTIIYTILNRLSGEEKKTFERFMRGGSNVDTSKTHVTTKHCSFVCNADNSKIINYIRADFRSILRVRKLPRYFAPQQIVYMINSDSMLTAAEFRGYTGKRDRHAFLQHFAADIRKYHQDERVSSLKL